jgi:hypothetical protein
MEDKNNSSDIFEGRTKEWNRNDWQGRSQEQVEGNYKILDGWAIYTAVTSLFI